ncbi:MAG: cytochrome c oxidase subunit 3 family protein [Bacteroidetes bacterium]|nr:MAG: cytochrome c oxidase subunit 3 family protein [Bacteroidota bacterium]
MEKHTEHTTHVHRDDEGDKMGMWLFIFTELLLFGMLFLIYAVYRYKNPIAFKLGGEELDVFMGTLNTVILLISSATVAMSITAIQRGKKKQALLLLGTTLFIAVVFLINKYFEWGAKIEYGFYPGGEALLELGHGTILFFGLYYVMSGIHAIHILIGIGLFIYVIRQIQTEKIHQTDYVWLENTGLYWHLVDLIWIFLFPLFYLIH